ncbi:MAG: metallophosphoesterase [Candidatus Gastranaerophilales bacterium]|nr:metallophosphoesterase [Candidatus Gastranaerophilales bacterium]
MKIDKFFTPQPVYDKNDTQLNVFYFNDLHGDVHRLGNLAKAHDSFERQSDASKLTVTSGDFLYGQNKKRNNLVLEILHKIKTDFVTLGNHEFDSGTDKLSNYLENASFETVCANIKLQENNNLKKRIKDKKLVKSSVCMKNGKRFGVIGVAPNNESISAKDKNNNATKALSTQETIDSINEEAKQLEEQGINKIILLSHMGYEADKKIAQETEGVDVIIGGHSHDEINGVGTHNLFQSKRNEPVIITQAGKNNHKVGFLDVVFNSEGILKTSQIKNRITNVVNWEKRQDVADLTKEKLGHNEKLAQVTNPYVPQSEAEEREQENPIADILTDAMLWASKGKADIALLNSGTLHGGFDEVVTTHDVVYNNLPYSDDILLVDIDEKTLVDMLDISAQSVYDNLAGSDLLQTSGMQYVVSRDGVQHIKLNNGRVIDPQNPSDKKVSLAVNRYLFQSDYTSELLEPVFEDAVIIGDLQNDLMNYMKKKQVLTIEKDDRIRVL